MISADDLKVVSLQFEQPSGYYSAEFIQRYMDDCRFTLAKRAANFIKITSHETNTYMQLMVVAPGAEVQGDFDKVGEHIRNLEAALVQKNKEIQRLSNLCYRLMDNRNI